MKKNKTVAYMLAATLLVGGTFVGTKALFSETETSENELILTTGKVDIELTSDIWSKYKEDDINYENPIKQDNVDSFENVEPGDKFVKNIYVKNNSTYGVNLAIKKELHNIPENLKDYITISNTGDSYLTKDGTKTIRVEVKLQNTDEAWTALNGAGKLDLNALYTITATQEEK